MLKGNHTDDGKFYSYLTGVPQNAMKAKVPGTVLANLIDNNIYPNPFFGFNIAQIPDISKTGVDEYTYWFTHVSEINPKKDCHYFLQFRGINYNAEVFVNGTQLKFDNSDLAQGMFLRQTVEITNAIKFTSRLRIAVLVHPPALPGIPNGGQGGDGMIAHQLCNQFVAGWDWIQAIPDRNTGIWDKVLFIETKSVDVQNTHITTEVPGVRLPQVNQKQPAFVHVTTELKNLENRIVNGTAICYTANKKVTQKVTLQPYQSIEIYLPTITIEHPKLWWANGQGEQHLEHLNVQFIENGSVSDSEAIDYGIREITYPWNTTTNSREIRVNRQPIFIKGGNWIMTDALLRFTDAKYDAEVRMHHDMNLNMIRVWGGGITERPEFYSACDKYGILVFQDFWASGDCNGRWFDPTKKEDTNTRRKYPDDHALFIKSVADQLTMLRNHPSLAIWCGGNEIRPPKDILDTMKQLIKTLDGTRFFFEFSNHDSMSLHSHDGPYTIKPEDYFWKNKTYPFNSEMGNVGLGEYNTTQKFLTSDHETLPYFDAKIQKWVIDTMWKFHKFYGYDSIIYRYGNPKNLQQYCKVAQLVNYNQYRSMMESVVSGMWHDYTGLLIWKTQNPWTAMVGQMYDYYLDPNGCLYGVKEACKPIHVMLNPVNYEVYVVNSTGATLKHHQLKIEVFNGVKPITTYTLNIKNTAPYKIDTLKLLKHFKNADQHQPDFFRFVLVNRNEETEVDENFYPLANANGNFECLKKLKTVSLKCSYHRSGNKLFVTVKNKSRNFAFFNRVNVWDDSHDSQVLPVFYSDNYFNIPAKSKKKIIIELPANAPRKNLSVIVNNWTEEIPVVSAKK